VLVTVAPNAKDVVGNGAQHTMLWMNLLGHVAPFFFSFNGQVSFSNYLVTFFFFAEGISMAKGRRFEEERMIHARR
jgi:hypothetical protein